jgi:hypothetical protein
MSYRGRASAINQGDPRVLRKLSPGWPTYQTPKLDGTCRVMTLGAPWSPGALPSLTNGACLATRAISLVFGEIQPGLTSHVGTVLQEDGRIRIVDAVWRSRSVRDSVGFPANTWLGHMAPLQTDRSVSYSNQPTIREIPGSLPNIEIAVCETFRRPTVRANG